MYDSKISVTFQKKEFQAVGFCLQGDRIVFCEQPQRLPVCIFRNISYTLANRTEAYLKLFLVSFQIEFCSLSSITICCSIFLLSPLTVMNWQLVQFLSTRLFNKYCMTLGTFYIASTAEKQKSTEFAHIYLYIHTQHLWQFTNSYVVRQLVKIIECAQ